MLLLSACSGAGTSLLSPPEVTSTTTIPTETTTTVAPATTTTLPVEPAPTTAAPRPVAQFTGEEVTDLLTRPAFLVKIDNHEVARPQWGINEADVVFE